MNISKRKRRLLSASLPALALNAAAVAFAVTRYAASGGSARADEPFYGPTPPVGKPKASTKASEMPSAVLGSRS